MVKRIKVLAFIDWYRPGYKAGGTITAFGNFVDHLEDEIDFNIVTRNVDYSETEPYASIPANKWVTSGKSNCYYISEDQLTIKTIKNIIKTSDYDVLYVNGMYSFYFSILPVLASKKGRVIMNPHGMLSEQAFSVKPLKKNLFLALANSLGCYKNVIFHVANEEEGNRVQKKINKYKAIKLANQFARKIKSESLINTTPKKNPRKFICISRISQEKGILKMIKAVQKVKAHLVLDLYGPLYDAQYWDLCKIAIKQLPENISFNYLGSVEGGQIPNLLKTYDYFMLLSEGENFGHAILEGLSAGLPIIISDQTPWKDLQSKGIGWDIHNESVKIPEIIETACKMSNEEYSLMSQNCFKFAKDFCNNKEVLKANRALFKN